MPEVIKRITADDLRDKLVEYYSVRGMMKAKYFLVNSIDIMDFVKSITSGLIFSAKDGSVIVKIMFNGIQIIRSDDIPHGEIYVV